MEEPEEQGIACALGKICSLESRLRDAIQSTHSLTRSYGRDMGAVDRERAALLVIREHLEGLEDKLREYKTAVSDPKMYDDKAIALSQMDTYRKELLRHARDRVDEVMFNKDVVKDIMAFADTGAGDESLPEVSHDTRDLPQSQPQSPAPSSDNDDASCAFTGEYSEAGTYLPSSNAASPYAAHKEGFPPLLNVEEGQENGFPYPVPATTPSMHSTQTKDYTRIPESRGPGMFVGLPAAKMPSRTLQQYPSHDLGSEMVAASRAPQDHGKWSTKPPRNSGTRSGYDSLASSRTHFDAATRAPSSYMGSYQASNEEPNAHGGRYQHDPTYGGKLSFKGRDQNSAQNVPHSVPTSPVALADPPRIRNDPSYAEPVPRSEPSRVPSPEQEKNLRASAMREAASPIQANRSALERRAAANRPQPKPRRQLNPLRGLQRLGGGILDGVAGGLRKLGSTSADALAGGLKKLGAARKLVPRSSQVMACVRVGLTGALGAAALLVIASAAKHPRYLKKMLPKRPVRAKAGKMPVAGPRADGHLVPDWMHRSQFTPSEVPPVGSLTATAGPPRGEMFPVIPPPTTSHVRG